MVALLSYQCVKRNKEISKLQAIYLGGFSAQRAANVGIVSMDLHHRIVSTCNLPFVYTVERLREWP